MPRDVDMSGRWGMLTVGARVLGTTGGAKWVCACDCGNVIEVYGKNLRKKKRPQHSCGCVSLGRRIHSMSKTAIYGIWAKMLQRCGNPKDPAYSGYGERGIVVCKRWHTFENFLADMGARPSSDHSIERRNNNGGYEPSNCYWLPRNRQSLNRRNNVYVEIDGETVTASEAARRLGVKYTTFRYRLSIGKTIKEAAL